MLKAFVTDQGISTATGNGFISGSFDDVSMIFKGEDFVIDLMHRYYGNVDTRLIIAHNGTNRTFFDRNGTFTTSGNISLVGNLSANNIYALNNLTANNIHAKGNITGAGITLTNNVTARHIHATGNITGNTTGGNFGSGTYTPTLTNVSNIDSSTAYQSQYIRIGNALTVSGKLDLDPSSAGASDTQLGISLPIASNIGAEEDCAGTAFGDSSVANIGALIKGDAANNRATLEYTSLSGASETFFYTMTCEII